MRQREKVVPLARGGVLEVGIGSGLNLASYDRDSMDRLYGLDPSPDMTARFDLAETEARYLPGWRPARFNYWGVAQ